MDRSLVAIDVLIHQILLFMFIVLFSGKHHADHREEAEEIFTPSHSLCRVVCLSDAGGSRGGAQAWGVNSRRLEMILSCSSYLIFSYSVEFMLRKLY